MVGTSKGGDIALNMAINIPEVTCTVVINCAVASFTGTMRLSDGSCQQHLPWIEENILVWKTLII